MSSKEIIDYVMNTPHNTNPVILGQMLKDVSNTGGNVDITFEGETMIISTANNAVNIDGETLIL